MYKGLGIVQNSSIMYTLTLIRVPEQYFFQYQFYAICFNKITLHFTSKHFFQLVDILETPEPRRHLYG